MMSNLYWLSMNENSSNVEQIDWVFKCDILKSLHSVRFFICLHSIELSLVGSTSVLEMLRSCVVEKGRCFCVQHEHNQLWGIRDDFIVILSFVHLICDDLWQLVHNKRLLLHRTVLSHVANSRLVNSVVQRLSMNPSSSYCINFCFLP